MVILVTGKIVGKWSVGLWDGGGKLSEGRIKEGLCVSQFIKIQCTNAAVSTNSTVFTSSPSDSLCASAPSIRRNCSSIPQLILSSITYVCWNLKHEIIESYVAVEYCFGLTWPLKKSLIFIETFYVWSFNLSLCSFQTAFAAHSTHMTYFRVNLDGPL